MGRKIEVKGFEATLSGGVWTSEDKDLAKHLNTFKLSEVGTYYPDIDLAIMNLIQKEIPETIVLENFSDTTLDLPEGTVY